LCLFHSDLEYLKGGLACSLNIYFRFPFFRISKLEYLKFYSVFRSVFPTAEYYSNTYNTLQYNKYATLSGKALDLHLIGILFES